MKFSQRMGIVPEKQIQLDDMDDSLRNRIINKLQQLSAFEARHILDKMGEEISENINITDLIFDRTDTNLLLKFLRNCEWYKVYDCLDFYLQHFTISCDKYDRYNGGCRSCSKSKRCETYRRKMGMINEINIILEEEKSGYRIINGVVATMTNPVEIESIEQSMLTAYPAVNTHLSKALDLYSDRQNPDYENSIKESISAVEAMCSIIVGKDTTLGKALNQLEKKGIIIHKSLEQAYNRIYGYTSDEKGIRHAGIDFTDAPAEDAKYMLVSCSAFVNYLTEKYEKVKGIDHEKDENGNKEYYQ